MDERHEKRLAAFKGLFEGVNRKALVNALTTEPSDASTDKPMKRSEQKMPYYREKFALQMKSIIDGMMIEYAAGQYEERIFKYSDFENKLSKNSLYLKVMQSLMYLVDKLDTPDKKYKSFRDIIEARKHPDGIKLVYNLAAADSTDLVAHSVTPSKEQRSIYRDEIDKYLLTARVGDEYRRNNLHLSPDEKSAIEVSLLNLENFLCKISNYNIWIVKISE